MMSESNTARRHFVRVFSGADGMAVLRHLRRMTIEKVVGPNASDSDLRWDAAQRALMRYIEQMAQPDASSATGG